MENIILIKDSSSEEEKKIKFIKTGASKKRYENSKTKGIQPTNNDSIEYPNQLSNIDYNNYGSVPNKLRSTI